MAVVLYLSLTVAATEYKRNHREVDAVYYEYLIPNLLPETPLGYWGIEYRSLEGILPRIVWIFWIIFFQNIVQIHKLH